MNSASYGYIERYNLLEEAFADERYRECVRFAKHLLADGNMPRHVYIKTCILIACATDDLNEAELYRKGAETAWSSARKDADNAVKDEQTEEYLEQLRGDLDELKPLGVYQDSAAPKKVAGGADEMQDAKWDQATNELDKIESQMANLDMGLDDSHMKKIQDLLDSLKI